MEKTEFNSVGDEMTNGRFAKAAALKILVVDDNADRITALTRIVSRLPPGIVKPLTEKLKPEIELLKSITRPSRSRSIVKKISKRRK